MKKIWFIILASILFGTVSCTKDGDEDEKTEWDNMEAEDIIGHWTATAGKYDLTLDITASGYDFRLSEPGNGFIWDAGTWEIDGNGLMLVGSDTEKTLMLGGLQNGKLVMTFVDYTILQMIGTQAASQTIFTRSEGSGEEEGFGFLVIQNLSEDNDIIEISIYDDAEELVGSDTEPLEPGYQFTYEDVMTGNYIVEVRDDDGESYTSKSFEIVDGKATVLEYDGSGLDVSATGVDMEKSASSKAAGNKASNFRMDGIKKEVADK